MLGALQLGLDLERHAVGVTCDRSNVGELSHEADNPARRRSGTCPVTEGNGKDCLASAEVGRCARHDRAATAAGARPQRDVQRG
jgi:hypothetical protein